MPMCLACTKGYSSKGNLSKHHRENMACGGWTKVNNDHIYDLVQGGMFPNASEMLGFIRGDRNSLECPYCQKQFANQSSLNKHLQNSIVCDKWRQYNVLSNAARLVSDKELRSLNKESNDSCCPEVCVNSTVPAPTTPSPCQLCHIIWNVYLVDKETAKKENFETICLDNGIEYIVGIFPDLSTLTNTISFDVECGLLAYSGHEPTLSFDAFDKEISKIEELRSHGKNVAVVCNTGYQRSFPFLVYYLMNHHPDEFPTIPKAVDIVLPQVDKANFAKTRDQFVDSITKLFSLNHFWSSQIRNKRTI